MIKKKNLLLFFALVFISIGFAVLSSNLSLISTLTFKENNWDVHIENGKVEEYSITNAKITVENTDVNIQGTFNAPGDYVDYSFVIVNNGTLNAQLNSIIDSLTEDEKKYISYSLKYAEDTTELTKDDTIYAGQAKKVIAHFEYKYDVETFATFENLDISLQLKYIQQKDVKETVWNYDYTGIAQTFYAPKTGNYKIELWGGEGVVSARYNISTAKGGYTSGQIKLTKGTKLYIYIGAKGYDVYNQKTFNSGTSNADGFNGGGATDVRLINGAWDNFDSLKSRIMVAAGGGCASFFGNLYGIPGDAGGLIGYPGGGTLGGTQTSPGAKEADVLLDSYFGIANGGVTGGNGYFPGGGAYGNTGSGGGSEYISGHNGCVAITQDSTKDNIESITSNGVKCQDGTKDIGCSYHYSGYIFTNTVMIDGKGYKWTTEKASSSEGMPTHDGTNKMTGNNGNGYAKITFLQ